MTLRISQQQDALYDCRDPGEKCKLYRQQDAELTALRAQLESTRKELQQARLETITTIGEDQAMGEELQALRARVAMLEGVIARSLAECREMQRQAESTSWPFEWERRVDDLEDALAGAYPFTRGDDEWEQVNAQLADAMKVVDAARVVSVDGAPTVNARREQLEELTLAIDDYDAKHGKAK